jgi:hypothetical protein
MKKFFITENEKKRIKRLYLINEQEEIRNGMVIFDCANIDYEDGDTSRLKLPKLLSNLMDATLSFSLGDWDEDGIVRAFENCKSQSEFDQTKQILNCAIPKIGMGGLKDGNSLLTIARKAFTSTIMGMGTTDIGDEDNKNKVQSVFSKYGLRTRI